MAIQVVLIFAKQTIEGHTLNGAFQNGTSPGFIENQNLHQLLQGGRGSVVMYNPVPSQNTDPAYLQPGSVYWYAIINHISDRNNTILLYEFNDAASCMDGSSDYHGGD